MTARVIETYAGRDAQASVANGIGYMRSFHVVYPRGTVVDQGAAASVAGIPRIGNVYQGPGGIIDPRSFCQSVTSKPHPDAPWIFTVECQYSSSLPPGWRAGNPNGNTIDPAYGVGSGGGGTGGGGVGSTPGDAAFHDNPLLKPWHIEFSGQDIEITPLEDYKGKKYLNSAGHKFDNPPTITLTAPVIKVTRNEADFSLATLNAFKNHTNDHKWGPYEAERVRCSEITASTNVENGVFFWTVNYTFIIAPDGIHGSDPPTWNKRILDAGWYYWSGPTKIVPFRDDFGQRLATPGLLDGEGNALDPEAVRDGDVDPVYLEFTQYPDADFSFLKMFGEK